MLNKVYNDNVSILLGRSSTTTVSDIKNSQMYSDIVLLTGVGYRVELLSSNVLRLDVGYSHYVKVSIPNDVNVVVDSSGMRVTLSSTNKQLRGDTLYKVVSVRPRNPYTGAGIVIISKIDTLRKLKSTKAEKTK